MPNIEVTILGENWDEVNDLLRKGSDPIDGQALLDAMPLQEILLYADKRATAEGYDVEVTKAGAKPVSAAEQRKAEAKAKLRGDLEGSLAAIDANPAEPTDEETPAEAPDPTAKPVKVAAAKKAKANGGLPESNKERKDRCIARLHDLFSGGHKKEVMKILSDLGGGVKNFAAVPEESFGPISEALEALQV